MDASEFDFGLQLDTARLQEFLGKLCRSQEESEEREKELATTLEKVLKRLEKRDQDFEEQRQALQRLQEDVSRLTGRYDDFEKLKISEKVERFDNHHNDFKSLQAQLAQLDTKVKSHEAAVSHVEGRSTAVEDRQNTVEEGFQELLTEFSSLKANQTSVCGHCEDMEARCVEVERRQDELAASVQNKYDNLWRGVEHSLESISTAELKKHHHDIRAVSGEIEKRMNMQISYCLDILARATETNRLRDLKRAVILRWREQAWLASRRKVGLMRLVKCIHAPVRNCFRRWLFHVRWTYEVEIVKRECKSLIPDLHALLTGSVNPRLQSLEHGVETEARKTNLLAERNKELWERLQAVTDRAQELECKSKADAKVLESMTCELENHARFRQAAEQRVQDAEGLVAQLSEQLTLVAREDDVKNMMKDILLIWTSVKQLDAAKADRKEVDNLGAEIHNNCQVNVRNNANDRMHVVDPTRHSSESTLDQRLSELQSGFEQSDSKCKELEFMLGLVVKLLEEIASAQLSSMHQARRVTGGRLGSGRLEGRLNLRATPRPAYESEFFSEPIRNARPFHAGQQSGVQELDREKVTSGIQCRPLHPEAATAKGTQAFTQLQGPDLAGKKPVRQDGSSLLAHCIRRLCSSPSVAAFAEWVDSVRKTMELKQGMNESGNLVPYFSHIQIC
ncbi:hypothetical protein Esti_003811 [Eimeria stiedai]